MSEHVSTVLPYLAQVWGVVQLTQVDRTWVQLPCSGAQWAILDTVEDLVCEKHAGMKIFRGRSIPEAQEVSRH